MSSNNAQTIEVRDLRQQDWVWISRALLFHEKIDGNTYKVYSGLASYANNFTQEAFPSITTLASRLHMTRNTVLKGLFLLEENGFIGVERKQGEHNVYILLSIANTGPLKKQKQVPQHQDEKPAENWVKEILQWAETRKGNKFVTYGKQVGALGAMKKAGYLPDEIKACYTILEASDFWRERGFDFKNVGDELPKKITSIRKQLHGTSIFDHLVTSK